MNGIVNFYKPKNMTSHDAVNICRKIFNTRRVGHGGTLDPNVTGVLPICIGKATRVAEYLLESDKEYIGELTLGHATDTQDIDGEIVKSSIKEATEDEIEESFKKFTGEITQIPPMFSAVKHKGKKLYELAREGKTVVRKPRISNIYQLEIIKNTNNKEILFYTHCSKGTYIRTLCNDIGLDLNTYGFMSYLIRVGVGQLKIEDSLSIEYLRSLDSHQLSNILIPMDTMLTELKEIQVPNTLYNKLINGVQLLINKDPSIKLEEDLRVYCLDKFIGIGSIVVKDDLEYLKMNKVLI